MKINEEFQQSQQKLLTNKEGILHNFDVIYDLNPTNTIHLCEQLLKKPSIEELEESSRLEEQFIKKVSNDEAGVEIILLALKNAFAKDTDTFTFAEESTAKTQLSAKIITSGFLENTMLFVEHLKDEEEKWKFEDLYMNEKLDAFQCWYRQRLSKKYEIDEKSIVIRKIVKGCIIVEWTTIKLTDTFKIFSANKKHEKQLKVHRYFRHFSLSPKDFDPKGNIEFDVFPSSLG